MSAETHPPIFDSQAWVNTDRVYFARDIFTDETVVVKLEPVKGRNCTLEHKFSVYERLNRGTGIPLARWFGTDSGFRVMTIDGLGPSLEDLFFRSGFKFTIKIILPLARQLVSKLTS